MRWKITHTKDRRFETAVPCWIVHKWGDADDDLQAITCWTEAQADMVHEALNAAEYPVKAEKLFRVGDDMAAAALSVIQKESGIDALDNFLEMHERWILLVDPIAQMKEAMEEVPA